MRFCDGRGGGLPFEAPPRFAGENLLVTSHHGHRTVMVKCHTHVNAGSVSDLVARATNGMGQENESGRRRDEDEETR
jgi:hypothetical protein